MKRCGFCVGHLFCEPSQNVGVSNPPSRWILVGGPRPFLNVLAENKHHGNLYNMSDRRQLRRLRDALTSALTKPKRAGKGKL